MTKIRAKGLQSPKSVNHGVDHQMLLDQILTIHLWSDMQHPANQYELLQETITDHEYYDPRFVYTNQ